MIKFTQIIDRIQYPSNIKGRLSSIHADIITYIIDNFENTNNYKRKVIALLNTLSYYTLEGNSLPSDWSIDSPLDNIELVDQSLCESALNGLFIKVKDISWDIEPTNRAAVKPIANNPNKPNKSTAMFNEIKESKAVVENPILVTKKVIPTPKESLYLKPPIVPQFDITAPWLHQTVNGIQYAIYKSLPEIPVMQSQISVTTDISKLTASDLMKLYPNCYIKTRPACMYEQHDSLTLDSDVGIILPIMGYSPKQVKDNIIKYPHWFKLVRILDGQFVNFYSHIEIDGELKDTLQIWDTLPESRKIPRTSDFIKEYVVRRYLLERDLKKIEHKYPLFGSLDPFLTLFNTPEEYARLGYKDAVDIAKACVNSRIEYKRTRNPIIRAVQQGGVYN